MVGKRVWSKFGDHTLRFGKVVEEKIRNGWVFVKIDWIDDKAFEQACELVANLGGIETNQTDAYITTNLRVVRTAAAAQKVWYRIDQVSFFEKNRLINTINKL